MTDQNAHLFCLNQNGRLLWQKLMGGVFSEVRIFLLESPESPYPLILTCTNLSSSDTTSSAEYNASMFRIYDLDGKLIKQIYLQSNQLVRKIIPGDLNKDGIDEIIAALTDGQILVLDQNLEQLQSHALGTQIDLFAVDDFAGNGSNQILGNSQEGMLYLFDNHFNILAAGEYAYEFQYSYAIKTRASETGLTLLLRNPSATQVNILYIQKRPFFSIVKAFILKHYQSFFAVILFLVAALVFSNYHRHKVKRNLNVISRQRDELEQTKIKLQKTLDDLKTAQLRLVQSEKMASLSMLVAGIAHEINNAIAGLTSQNNTAGRAVARLRKMMTLADEIGPDLNRITEIAGIAEESNLAVEDAADRIARIVKRLRSFARLDEAELQRIDINESLENTLEMIQSRLGQKALVTKDYGHLPKIACYPSQLNQVFLNILLNAQDAIETRGEISVETRCEDQQIYISISDTGNGIPPEKLEKIFDPGFTTKGVGVGIGLGLSIRYQIIQDHNGETSVASKPGLGTTVTIRLPLELNVELNP